MLTRCSIAVLRFVNEIVFDGSAMKDSSQTDPLPKSAPAQTSPVQNVNPLFWVLWLCSINPIELAENVLHHAGGPCQIHRTILLPETIVAEGAFDVI
jgi:hypothetical protein